MQNAELHVAFQFLLNLLDNNSNTLTNEMFGFFSMIHLNTDMTIRYP